MTAWPLLAGRLVSWLPTLPGWAGVAVYDGPPVTADVPGSYVTVGFVLGEDNGGSYDQVYLAGGLLEETGTVHCEIVCWTGDVDLATMRTQAFALADALQAAMSADGTLGGVVRSAAMTVDVRPVQTTAGAEQRLMVTLNYTAIGI